MIQPEMKTSRLLEFIVDVSLRRKTMKTKNECERRSVAAGIGGVRNGPSHVLVENTLRRAERNGTGGADGRDQTEQHVETGESQLGASETVGDRF